MTDPDPWTLPAAAPPPGPAGPTETPGPVEHAVPPDEPDDPGPDTPADIDAEKSLLGAMMLSPDALLVGDELVKGVDFWHPAHEAIFDTITGLFHATGEIPDPVTVATALRKTPGQLRRIGGAAYLHDLTTFCPSPRNADRYARLVAEAALLRRVDTAGTRLRGLARSGATAEDVAAQAVAEVTAAVDTTAGTTAQPAGEVLADVADQLGEPLDSSGVLWPGRDLNTVLLPMRRGQLIVIGARPAIGKTTAAIECAVHAAVRQRIPTLLWTCEMDRTEVVETILAAEGGIRKRNITDHTLDAAEWDKLWRVHEKLGDAPLLIEDDPDLHLEKLDRALRRGHAGARWGLVVVDYLQLMTTHGRRPENRQVEVDKHARGLKELAMRHGVPIIALSQLNRALEARADKRPGMADLRESGGIEAHANVIILLHRPDAHDPNDPRAGEADFIVAKQRRGPTDTVTRAQQLHLGRFVDMAA